MSIHDLRTHALAPAVPKREPLIRRLLARLAAWWKRPPNVPAHLREGVGLPPLEPSVLDFPLIDVGHKRDRKRKNGDWLH